MRGGDVAQANGRKTTQKHSGLNWENHPQEKLLQQSMGSLVGFCRSSGNSDIFFQYLTRWAILLSVIAAIAPGELGGFHCFFLQNRIEPHQKWTTN